MNIGFSILVCCYNSVERIQQTLINLCKLEQIEGFPTEIIIIDNNSNDQTIEKVREVRGALECSIPFRIVSEKIQGLTNARIKGIKEAKYEYLIFCDDDNWLFPDYLKVVFENFKNCDCYAVGGMGIAKTNGSFPEWFSEFEGFGYAVGGMKRNAGKGQFLYGAGMAIKRGEALKYAEKVHLLNDRTGSKLSSGGDTELNHILGVEHIYFDPNLKFFHFLPSNRLTWNYYKKLNSSFGEAQSSLLYYKIAKKPKFKAFYILLTKIYHSFNFLIFYSLKFKTKKIEIEYLFNYHFFKGSILKLSQFSKLYFLAKNNLG